MMGRAEFTRTEITPGTFLTFDQVAERLVGFSDWPGDLYLFPEPVKTKDGPKWRAEDIARYENRLCDLLGAD
ncbi:hypothetical protein [Thalassospira indica]|uniref:Uncharacterized protein n=1 Tax=Thalassospira indica TaxID=1891279 RepID=A0ABM6XUG5_9PROT|nr:hypothetical protein [Thalassospira indica]AXO13303.1 hypothetical protein DY252_02800 [Thalassospira indica]OAZ14826.1 hypothetical protein TH15_03240 [Thalassospira profundimaris]